MRVIAPRSRVKRRQPDSVRACCCWAHATVASMADESPHMRCAYRSSFNASSGSATVTVTLPTQTSAVVVSIVPSPVYQQTIDADGYSWFFTVRLSEIAGITGRRPPHVKLPWWPLFPIAHAAEAVARLTGKEPLCTVDGLNMSKNRMFFSSAKAERELGYRPSPYLGALRTAVGWFGREGYLK